MPKQTISSPARPVLLDARGVDGIDASPGKNGMPGVPGGNASKAHVGGNGGRVDVYMWHGADATHYKATVQGIGTPVQSLEATLQRAEFLAIDASGGKGGRGGVGGDGGNGVPGERGRDSVLSVRGTPGSDGGNGGDGGEGSDGGPGGHGGQVTIRLPKRDMDLLAAVRTRVGGGPGGLPGRHGRGGAGGAGGNGGKTYAMYGPVTYERDGNPGSPGATSAKSLAPGEDGEPGSVEYIVEEPGRPPVTFTKPWSLQVTSVRLRGPHSTFLEYGQPIDVQVTVTNTSDMPTPSDKVLRLCIRPSPNIEAKFAATLPPDLYKHRKAPLPALQFQVPHPDTPPARRPLGVTHTLELVVSSPRLSLDAAPTIQTVSFTVGYPVRLTNLQGDHGSDDNRPAALRFDLKNLSDQPLGHERNLAYTLRVGGGNVPSHAVFFQAHGDSAPQPIGDGLQRAVKRLRSRQTLNVCGDVRFASNVPRNARTRLMLGISLDDAEGTPRLIQEQAFDVAKGRSHDTDTAPIVLITNELTSVEEIAAWERLADELGTRVRIVDRSGLGPLHLAKAAPGAGVEGNADISELCAGKTVVLLNNAGCEPNDNATAFFEPDELVAAAARGISTYVVGPLDRLDMAKAISAPQGQGSASVYMSMHKFERAYTAKTTPCEDIGGQAEIYVRTAGYPTPMMLQREALALHEWLLARDPGRTFSIQPIYAPAPINNPSISNKPWHLGSLKVVRGVDAASHVAVQHGLDDASVHAPEKILSPNNRFGLCKALPFNEKLAALERIIVQDPARNPSVNPLIDAIVADVMEEYVRVSCSNWRCGLSTADFVKNMPRLDALTRHNFPRAPGDESPIWANLVRLLGAIMGGCQARSHIGDSVLAPRRAELVEMVLNMVESLGETVFHREHFCFADAALEVEARQIRRMLQKPGQQHKLLERPIGIVTEYDQLPGVRQVVAPGLASSP